MILCGTPSMLAERLRAITSLYGMLSVHAIFTSFCNMTITSHHNPLQDLYQHQCGMLTALAKLLPAYTGCYNWVGRTSASLEKLLQNAKCG